MKFATPSRSRFRPSLRSFARIGGLGAVLSLLAGCATTATRPESAVALPADWSSSPSPAATATTTPLPDLASWWNRFDDPTLTKLIDTALTDSPDLRTALSRIEVARAQRGLTRAANVPTLSAGVSGASNATHVRAIDNTDGADAYAGALDASWEIDLFGTQRNTLAAADADLNQAAYNYQSARVSLSAEVAIAYLNLRAAEERLAINERTRESRERTAHLAEVSEQAGVGDVLAIRQAQNALEQTLAALPQLRQSVTTLRNQLAVLCGATPTELDALLGNSSGIPAAPAPIAVGIPAETLQQRPDVRAAALAVEAAVARGTAARRERLPSLTLRGSLGANSSAADNLFLPETIVASLAGSLAAPIFDAGRIRQNIVIQDELIQQAAFAYDATVLNALAEAENALAAVRNNREQLAALQRALATARETDLLARQRFQAGQVDYLQVLDAERTLLGLEESVANTTASATAAHIQLYRALGGGWSPLAAQS